MDLVSLWAGPCHLCRPLYVIDAAGRAGVSPLLWSGWQQRFWGPTYRRLRPAAIKTPVGGR